MPFTAYNIETGHLPVMLAEVVQTFAAGEKAAQAVSQELGPKSMPGYRRFLDGTLGLGGHTEGILEGLPGAQVIGLDRDGAALDLARERLKPFAPGVHFRQLAFADFAGALDELEWNLVDGALIDLGVSSLQLDTAERGFSFLQDGPLDMRMDTQQGENAATLVNTASVDRLIEIISLYGEDPQAGRIGRAIAEARAQSPVESTAQLAAIVEKAYPPKWRATARNHPATRTFQALRMVVNDELGQLGMFLERIVPRLAPGGRLAVISFHSLEDRMVKHFFKTASVGCLCPSYITECVCGHEASLRILTKKPVEASPEELARNPRARSAKLRVAERTDKVFSLPKESCTQAVGGKSSNSFTRPAGRKTRHRAGYK